MKTPFGEFSPVIAGLAKSAIHFRRNNDCIAKHLDANVQNSLHSDNLPLRTIRKFARKTRDYLRAYADPSGRTETHGDVEKLRGKFKCHRYHTLMIYMYGVKRIWRFRSRFIR